MKILIAEDDFELASTLKRILSFEKYDIENAYNGIQALDEAMSNEYDCIILDVMMPKMDGFGVARTLRENNISTPILMLTAKAEIDDRVNGLDSGADDYLTKPFQIKELLARVRALIRRNNAKVSLNSFGDLALDSKTFELSCNGKSTRLTNKEYKLMECFLNKHETLLSTERLMELVWDIESEAEINVVWSYISSLRKKLASIDSKYTLVAVRGIGYKLGEKDGKGS